MPALMPHAQVSTHAQTQAQLLHHLSAILQSAVQMQLSFACVTPCWTDTA